MLHLSVLTLGKVSLVTYKYKAQVMVWIAFLIPSDEFYTLTHTLTHTLIHTRVRVLSPSLIHSVSLYLCVSASVSLYLIYSLAILLAHTLSSLVGRLVHRLNCCWVCCITQVGLSAGCLNG